MPRLHEVANQIIIKAKSIVVETEKKVEPVVEATLDENYSEQYEKDRQHHHDMTLHYTNLSASHERVGEPEKAKQARLLAKHHNRIRESIHDLLVAKGLRDE